MSLMKKASLILLLPLVLGVTKVAGYGTSNQAILLSQVRTLTLRANAKTAHRRVPSIPQLTCKGPGCRYYEVDIMRCKNQGAAYNTEDIEWSCSANLPAEFKLGSTDVICEGYSHPNDNYVLKGSCGVEYRLLLTDIGEEKYGQSLWGSTDINKKWPLANLLFSAIFLAVLIWIIYSAYRALPRVNIPGGFWGGDGGPWDPPPPYSRNKYSYDGSQHAWRPGFWSGILGGAAAGYFAGNRGARQQTVYRDRDYGSWLGRSTDQDFTIPRGNSPRPARHESTGFGSTRRR